MFRTKDSNGNVKYSGKSKATVLDTRDPLHRGRIIVDHPLLGETVWIDYLNTPGQYNPPSIGDIVFVGVEAGVQEFPYAWGNVVQGEDADPSVPEQFQRDVPSNRGWKTPGGHLIELDDGVATVTDAPNDTTFTTENRGVRITTSGGNIIHIDDANNVILIQNKQGKIFKLTDKQILGQGTEHMVLGDTWFNMMNTFLSSVISGIMPGTPGQNAASLLAIKSAANTLQSSLPTLKSPNSFTD